MKGKNVAIKQKREMVKAKCQSCGREVIIQIPFVGDVLCGECMRPSSWTLENDS